jgi:hypothetical protein
MCADRIDRAELHTDVAFRLDYVVDAKRTGTSYSGLNLALAIILIVSAVLNALSLILLVDHSDDSFPSLRIGIISSTATLGIFMILDIMKHRKWPDRVTLTHDGVWLFHGPRYQLIRWSDIAGFKEQNKKRLLLFGKHNLDSLTILNHKGRQSARITSILTNFPEMVTEIKARSGAAGASGDSAGHAA